jgi:hypothetical protein
MQNMPRYCFSLCTLLIPLYTYRPLLDLLSYSKTILYPLVIVDETREGSKARVKNGVEMCAVLGYYAILSYSLLAFFFFLLGTLEP